MGIEQQLQLADLAQRRVELVDDDVSVDGLRADQLRAG